MKKSLENTNDNENKEGNKITNSTIVRNPQAHTLYAKVSAKD